MHPQNKVDQFTDGRSEKPIISRWGKSQVSMIQSHWTKCVTKKKSHQLANQSQAPTEANPSLLLEAYDSLIYFTHCEGTFIPS